MSVLQNTTGGEGGFRVNKVSVQPKVSFQSSYKRCVYLFTHINSNYGNWCVVKRMEENLCHRERRESLEREKEVKTEILYEVFLRRDKNVLGEHVG